MKDSYYYRLKDVLVMLYGQWKRDFKDINVLMEILENDSISKERRYWLMIAGFRGLDLYEVEIDQDEISLHYNNLDKHLEYIQCQLLDKEVFFEINLN